MAIRLRFLLFFILGLVTLAAVGPANANSLDQVRQAGALRVGVALLTPWALKDSRDELIGFEVDVARKIADDLGVTAVIKTYPWNELIPALETGEIDMIAAGMGITPARALRVNFTQPYADQGITMATNTAKTEKVENLKDLNDGKYRIASVQGTVSEELSKRVFPNAKLEVFAEVDELLEALLAGEIDAYVGGTPIPQFLALDHPDTIDVPLSKPLLSVRTGFAVAKGNFDFLIYLNAWINARDADTWLPSTHNYWFNSTRWREKLEE